MQVVWQRGKRKACSLADERENKLTSLGFDWDLRNNDTRNTWDTRVYELLEYRLHRGNAEVPRRWHENR
jgi:hypothetical protein